MANLTIRKKVSYRTPKGASEGVGTIINILHTQRGAWYEVKDSNTGAIVRLRAANIELA